MIHIPAPDFDLEKTLDSGQVFHWQKVDDGFVGAIGDLPVYVRQQRHILEVRCGGTPQPARHRRALPNPAVPHVTLISFLQSPASNNPAFRVTAPIGFPSIRAAL